MVICLKIFLHVMKLCMLQLSMEKTDSSSHIVRRVSLLLFIVTNHARFWVHKFSSNGDRENRCGSPTMTFFFACVKYEDIFYYYLSIHTSNQLISFAICAISVFVRWYSEVPDAATLVETRPLHRNSALSRTTREEILIYTENARCNLHVCRLFFFVVCIIIYLLSKINLAHFFEFRTR